MGHLSSSADFPNPRVATCVPSTTGTVMPSPLAPKPCPSFHPILVSSLNPRFSSPMGYWVRVGGATDERPQRTIEQYGRNWVTYTAEGLWKRSQSKTQLD